MNLSCPPDAMGLFRATCGWKQKVLQVQHESRFHTQHRLRHPRNGRVGKTNDIDNCLPSTPPAREEENKIEQPCCERTKQRQKTTQVASHLHARASQSAEGGLCAGAGGLGLVSSGGAHLDVQGGDAQLLRSRYATQETKPRWWQPR